MGGSSSKKRPLKVEQKEDVIVQEKIPAGTPLQESCDLFQDVQDVQDVQDFVETVHIDHNKAESPKMIENDLENSNKTLSFDKEDLIDSNKIVSSENSFPTPGSSPEIFSKEPFPSNNLPTRPPLQFDQNNTVPSRKPPHPVVSDGLLTTSNRNQTSLGQSTRHFSSNISSVGNLGTGPVPVGNPGNGQVSQKQFSKSQNFYKSRDQTGSGRFNSYSGPVEDHTPSHFSGVYNRHASDPNTNKPGGDRDVASLLRKDKFSLLGSQLQQQESQIFSRSLQQTNGLSNGMSRSSAPFPAPSSTTYKFDPGKFRQVNESTPVISTGRNGSIKKTGLASGPLDDRDEELIASIEREFDFSY